MSKKVATTGRHYVLVNKESVLHVREKLTKKIEWWYHEAVPEDACPLPEQFGGPPGIGLPRSDCFSEGDNSFMTNSTKCFMSFSVSSLPLGENNPRTLPIWTVSGEPKHRYRYQIPQPPLGTRYRLMPPTQPLQCPTRYLALPIPNLLLEVRNMNNWVWKLQASR